LVLLFFNAYVINLRSDIDAVSSTDGHVETEIKNFVRDTRKDGTDLLSYLTVKGIAPITNWMSGDLNSKSCASYSLVSCPEVEISIPT